MIDPSWEACWGFCLALRIAGHAALAFGDFPSHDCHTCPHHAHVAMWYFKHALLCEED